MGLAFLLPVICKAKEGLMNRQEQHPQRAAKRAPDLMVVAAIVLIASLCALSPERAPAGTVRFQGALANLASANIANMGSRSLASAAVTIAAIPVVTGPLNADQVEDVPLGDEGEFEVDVQVSEEEDS